MRIVEILDALTDDEPIGKEAVISWMQSSDINILGGLMHLWDLRRHDIEPPLTTTETFRLLMRNFRCAVEDRDEVRSRLAFSPYEAGRALSAWASHQDNRAVIAELRDQLSALYRNGDHKVRECIIHCVLEHLLERPVLRSFFETWHDDDDLRPAFERALTWGEAHSNVDT